MPYGFKKKNGVMRVVIKGAKLGDVGQFIHSITIYATIHGTPSCLNEVSLQLEFISAWWDFHDFDEDGEVVSTRGKPSVNDKYIWASNL